MVNSRVTIRLDSPGIRSNVRIKKRKKTTINAIYKERGQRLKFKILTNSRGGKELGKRSGAQKTTLIDGTIQVGHWSKGGFA